MTGTRQHHNALKLSMLLHRKHITILYNDIFVTVENEKATICRPMFPSAFCDSEYKIKTKKINNKKEKN